MHKHPHPNRHYVQVAKYLLVKLALVLVVLYTEEAQNNILI